MAVDQADDEDMAQRGMLPKIRKTAQAAQPVARPTIRPVRVTKAPPPPAPPRKFPSGVAPRGSHEAYAEQPAHEQPYDQHYEQPAYEAQPQAYADPPEPREATTKNGYEDPPTMSAHGAPMPKPANVASPPPSSIRFDDETQMRKPDGRLIAATSRHQDDETWARSARGDDGVRSQAPSTLPYFPPPQDEHTNARNDQHLRPVPAPQQPDIYDSLPSLEIRRPYDTYEREFNERDPATQYGGRGEARDPGEHYPAPVRNDHHESYDQREQHYDHEQAPSTQHMPQHAPQTHHHASEPAQPVRDAREGSGARERPRKQSSQRRRNAYEESGEKQHMQAHEPPAAAYEPPPTRQPYPQAPSAVPHARTSEPAPRYEEPIIPPAPRVPAGFIVGVQPIRQAPEAQPQPQQPHHGGASFRVDNNDSFPAYAQPMQPAPAPSPRGVYAPMNAPAVMHQSPMHGTPSMHQGLHHQPAHHAGMHRGHPALGAVGAPMAYAQPAFPRQQPPMPAHPQRGMHPVGHQLQEQPSSTSKTLRFAWFVFGVAFGIGFTFFASGVVPGLKRDEQAPTATAAPSATFPPPAPILSNAPPPVQAPPAVQAPPPPMQAQAPVQAAPVQAPPPVLAPPPAVADNTALAGVTPGQLPQAKPAQTAVAPQAPAQPRVASAPPPRTRRASAPSNGGGGGGPRPLPNSGSVEAPDSEGGGSSASAAFGSSSSSSSSSAKAAEVPKDLFGAALNP